MKNCKACGEKITGYNKHRNHCYSCKVNYPFVSSKKNGGVFNRKESVKRNDS